MQTRLREVYVSIQEADGPATSELARELHEAAATSPAMFARFLASLPLNSDSALFEIYEVLLEEPTRHATVLLDELKRMLGRAIEEPHNAAIYHQLTAFALIQDSPLKNAIAAVLCEALQSPRAQIRRFAAELAGDVADDHGELQTLLRRGIERDPDRRVRLLAYESLRDLFAQRPSEATLPRLSLLDRWAAKLMDSRVRR